MKGDKYQIISCNTIPNLEAHVSNEIQYGWVVTGGLITYQVESREILKQPERFFAQAMIKTEPKK